MTRVKKADIACLRLAAQGLTGTRAPKPADVVRKLGAMQAQDYGQSLWAVGSRLAGGKGATISAVEAVIASGEIVRGWPMRGTIHLMAAGDVRWITALCAPRVLAASGRRMRELELTDGDVRRADELAGAAFAQAGGPVTRARLMETFEQAGLSTAGQRGYHLLVHLAQEGRICLGPLQGRGRGGRGGEQTFALLDSWIPATEPLDRDDALARLAHRFASSRGPVTAHDLARWSGLTVTDARRGLRSGWSPPGEAELVAVTIEGTDYWLSAGVEAAEPARGWREPLLLAGFDEYLIGYKGRDDILDPAHFMKIVPGGNGVFKPMIVSAGQIVGIWKRELTAKRLRIELTPFEAGAVDGGALDPDAAGMSRVLRAYQDFLELPPTVHLETPTLNS